MIKFKQFVAEAAKPLEQGALVDGVPNVVILKPKRAKQGDLDESGIPNVLILKGTRTPLAEKQSRGEEWESHNDNSHLGSDVHAVHKHLIAQDKTTDADKPHIRKYTEESRHLNTSLFKNHLNGEKHERHQNGHDTKALDSAVHRNKLGHDLHVYSGTSFNPDHMAKKHADRHIHLAAYTSTTIHKGIAKEFADSGDEHMHVLHIHLKKGQKGKYVAHHSPGNADEHEFVLPRHTTLKVHPEPSIHHDSYGSKYHVWKAHVVEGKKE